ncbi:MAG: ABC transporter ATP-binding protein [Phycisphaerae bacterium]|nr:ABC transporter ATP-binding protein [Phycisphaerae bacterium]
MTKPLLQATGISYHYTDSNWQLTNIDIEMHTGELLGIIGPNGAGKSTLLKILAGVIPTQHGKIKLIEQNLKKMPRRQIAKIMGYLPQSISSMFDYRVEQIVAMGRFAHLGPMGFTSENDIKIINQCLEHTDTIGLKDRMFSHLSGGERQRVLLAGVLAQQPQVLLLDEPTTGLDIHHQGAFFSLLRKLANQGLAIAVVTHDLNLASQACDRLVLMHKGQKIKDDNIHAVINKETLGPVYHHSILIAQLPHSDRPMVLPQINNE